MSSAARFVKGYLSWDSCDVFSLTANAGGRTDLAPVRQLPLHSNASLTCFRRCPREYQFRYVMLRRPRRKVEALRFGSFFHVGLNAWWACAGPESPEIRLLAAMHAVEDRASKNAEDADPFDMVKTVTLLAGYTTRWGDEDYVTIDVEKNFRLDYDTFGMVGSIDALVQRGGIIENVEHKTTAADISVGADYWRHVDTMDPQVSTYMAASRSLGYDVRDTLYDVIRKPTILPYKATPEDAKKYTKPTRAEPVPRLYANQREEDETPAEYGERLTADIVSKPDWYFQRRTVVRLEHDDAEHELDVLQTAQLIAFCAERGTWPRTPSACERYGRLCDYHEVCSGLTTIDDGTRFRTAAKQHEELA